MREQPPKTRSSGGPYRTATPPRPQATCTAQSDSERDVAKALAFVWATAALRFVIVCARHESATPDPVFAAILTFGIPAALFGPAFGVALRCLRTIGWTSRFT
jgi:hypothetical protein